MFTSHDSLFGGGRTSERIGDLPKITQSWEVAGLEPKLQPSSGPAHQMLFLGSPPPGRVKGLGRAGLPPEGTRLHRECLGGAELKLSGSFIMNSAVSGCKKSVVLFQRLMRSLAAWPSGLPVLAAGFLIGGGQWAEAEERGELFWFPH